VVAAPRAAPCYHEAVSDRVRIGTCSGLAEAALLRSMFTAHGIGGAIGAEHRVSVLTGLGGGFASLDIWVDEDEHEEALALLRSLRSGEADPGDHDEPSSEADDPHDGPCVDDASAHGHDEIPGELRLRIHRRRQTAVALLLGACVTFGTAHAFTRAWARATLLMIVEAIGIGYVIVGNSLGMVAVIGAVIADVTGALWRIHGGGSGAGEIDAEAARSPLPVARLRVR
jgi:hypothetical protein